MGSFSFKSSGTTQADVASSPTGTPTPIGIKTPLTLGDAGLLKMNFVLADQVTDNLRNLILTNWGERIGLYDYGSNLRPLLTDLVSLDDFDSSAITRIKDAVGRWMPYVDLEGFLSEPQRSLSKGGSIAAISLTITFNIPSLNVRGRELQVLLYAI